MSSANSQTIKFRLSNELAGRVKQKNNYSEWIRMALIERLERERLERLSDSSKQKESD